MNDQKERRVYWKKSHKWGVCSLLVGLIRSFLLYLILIAVIRLMGKRQLGQMEASEFVVTMLVADLAAVPMQDLGIPLLSGLIPILTVLFLELILSALSYYSITVRKLFCGKPVILMENGAILQENLKKTRLTPDELTELLREKSITDLSTVKYAILEANGQLSALLYPEFQPITPRDMKIQTEELALPVTIISGGKLLKENLKISGRDEKWLKNLLEKHRCSIKDVYLLTVEPSGKTYLSIKSEAV